ncbi:MAG: hypothetical protein HY508_12385 [Acidobacteria bacterium]|nr:hypothetical protein [Acidobacteriota bacterium]
MSKCDLQIKLDRADRTYRAGSKITGSVMVRAESDCECRGLTLMQGWRATGKGDPDGANLGETRLFSGLWRAGESASYPFELEAQPGPISYQGKLFHVDWHIIAQADIPMALDLKVDEVFVLVPGEQASIDGGAELAEENLGEHKTKSRSPNPLTGPAVGVGIGMGAFVLAAYLFWDLYPALSAGLIGEAPAWRLSLATVSGLIGLLALSSYVPRLLAARKIGAVDARLAPSAVRRGDFLRCAVSFVPRSDVHLHRAALTLWATEGASERVTDDDNKKTTKYYTERVYSTEVWLASERQLMADQAVTLEGTLKIPPLVPVSFKGIWNELRWQAAVRVNLRHCPDWEREFPVNVRP